MGYGSDTESRPSLPGTRAAPPLPRALGGGKARRGEAAVDTDTFLRMREEYVLAKQREESQEDKMRHLAAQLARTEEAAKRILTRTDPSAKGGVAQRLLDAERELGRVKAEAAELDSQLQIAKKQAGDYKRQAADLRKRLDAAMADQRCLALQLGRMQSRGCSTAAAASRSRSLATLSANAPRASPAAARASSPDVAAVMASAEAEAAAAARQFAEQQERLVLLQQQTSRLEQQLRQRDLQVQRQAMELTRLQRQLETAASFDVEGGVSGPGVSFPLAATVLHCGGGNVGQRTTDGSEDSHLTADGANSNAPWLRLKYLKAKSALENVMASNTHLLRQLDSTRAQLEQLQHQQMVRQVEGNVSGGGPSHALQAAAPAMDMQLHLRQQLAAANHRAARLQIELEAAQAKLAIYQAHTGSTCRVKKQSGACQQAPAEKNDWSQQLLDNGALKAERRTTTLATTAEGGTGALREAFHHQPQGQHGQPRQQGQQRYLIVELHLHGAELKELGSLGPLGMTFLTVDYFDAGIQMTPPAEGRSPIYNTTLQYTVHMTGALIDYLATGSASLELHCCQGTTSASGAVDYRTLATGSIPLRSLLEIGSGGIAACQYQHCTLRVADGTPCGTVLYTLEAVKPMHMHSAATDGS